MSKSRIASWHQPISVGAVVAAMMLLVLGLSDAFFTLYAVTMHGAEEVNPLMNKFLDWGPFSFLVVKYLLTAVGALYLAFYFRQKRLARNGLFGVLLVYSGIIIYHFIKLNQLN